MLRGKVTGLRARHDSDIPVLHAELYDDVATRVRADSRPWQPIPLGSGSPYVVTGPNDHAACFSVVELATGALAGEALLWNIDLHNRTAHIGISLLPHSASAGWAQTSSGCCAATGSRFSACTACRPRPLLTTTR